MFMMGFSLDPSAVLKYLSTTVLRRTAGADDCDNINIPADDLPEEHKQVVKSGRQKAALQSSAGGAKGKKKPRDDRDIYGMHNCDPHKYYKSGFGGFVPFTSDLVGMNSTAESHVGANRCYGRYFKRS